MGLELVPQNAPIAQPAMNAQPINQNNSAPAQVSIPGEFTMLPIPDSMSQTVASATGGGAVSKTIYFLNEAFFNATPTDNGSGGGSLTSSYGDGWSGKGYNQLATSMSAGGGNGIKCYGFTLEYITTATGAQNPSGLTTASPTILVANLVGTNQIPRGVPLSGGVRNTQFLSGTMTIQFNFTLNCLSQFSYVLPVGSTCTLSILTKPF